ncbi:hypothetical protein DPMN_072315 [Dreissena polymorpha]|uniref:Uncharacterized protein n=1 Tax=Dreissena polymorpha TaxID=45954 RepID=A0A9D4BWD1_DREPO|nr:hypothetical protein DPMN_072315 [Dreissena polymorpha]
MEGTVLKNILEAVYGENAIVHIMTEKTFKRALRGHFLGIKMAKEDPDIQILLDQAEELYPSLRRGETMPIMAE